ncbi:MAG: YetF domain-containing protein [Pseudomonadota bacterium]
METLFALQVPVWEIVLRGTLVYWFLFLIFRFIVRRDVGSVAIADVLLLVLIADASQNAMAGGYKTVSEGALLVATIVSWNYLLDWASFRFEWVRRLAEPPPLPLVWRGRILYRNLRKEFLPVEELKAHLRQKGIEDLSQVKVAYMESDGSLSVIRRR